MTPGPQPRSKFPWHFSLRGRKVLLQPLEPSGKEAMLDFAGGLSEEDLLFLDRDIAQPPVIDRWIKDAADGRLVTTTAWVDEAIVGYATMYRADVRWTRHVADLCVVVSEAMRGKGLGRLLLELMFEMALDAGVNKVVARMTPGQTAALSLFQQLGFEQEAVLQDHALDAHGCTHDLLMLSFHTGRHQDSACASCGVTVLNALTLDGDRLCSNCFESRYKELGGGD
jgi:L-amino acid N-acyltransferase YncA